MGSRPCTGLPRWTMCRVRVVDWISKNVVLIRYRPVRIPLSVFVVSDMLELAQAHASHRFAINEEESGESRILVRWFHLPILSVQARLLASLVLPHHSSTPSSPSLDLNLYILPMLTKPDRFGFSILRCGSRTVGSYRHLPLLQVTQLRAMSAI